MKRQLAIVAFALLAFALPASAHRLDEYLQATILTIDSGHLQASMRLIPGVAVSSFIIESIDTDHDGVFSGSEQRAYAQRVLNDLSLAIDGTRLTPQLISAAFPQPAEMQQGLGEIHIVFTADIPPGTLHRTFTLENRHRNSSSVYLVNAALPTDPGIRITVQKRNELQSIYELDYDQSSVAPGPSEMPQAPPSPLAQIDASTFATLFRLGVHHIVEGTDHLLFLLTLLLPAPLIAAGGRWTTSAGTRRSLIRVLKIVTAFTVGHSITLARRSRLRSFPKPPDRSSHRRFDPRLRYPRHPTYLSRKRIRHRRLLRPHSWPRIRHRPQCPSSRSLAERLRHPRLQSRDRSYADGRRRRRPSIAHASQSLHRLLRL